MMQVSALFEEPADIPDTVVGFTRYGRMRLITPRPTSRS